MKGYELEMRKFTNKYFGGVFTLVYIEKEYVEMTPEGSQYVINIPIQRFVQEFEEIYGDEV